LIHPSLFNGVVQTGVVNRTVITEKYARLVMGHEVDSWENPNRDWVEQDVLVEKKYIDIVVLSNGSTWNATWHQKLDVYNVTNPVIVLNVARNVSYNPCGLETNG
jgi:hypothetical protein